MTDTKITHIGAEPITKSSPYAGRVTWLDPGEAVTLQV